MTESLQLLVHRCQGQRTAPGEISCPGELLGLPACPPPQSIPSALLFLHGNPNTAAKGFQAWEGDGGQQGPVPSSFPLKPGDSPQRPAVTKTLPPNGTQHRERGVMRPHHGAAPSAGPPARPHPKLLGGGNGRRRGALSPLPPGTPGVQRGRAALARRLSPPGDTGAADSTLGSPWATHRTLCTKQAHNLPPRALTPPGLPAIASGPSRIRPAARGSCADDSHPQPGCSAPPTPAPGGSHRFLGHSASVSSHRAHPGEPGMGGARGPYLPRATGG